MANNLAVLCRSMADRSRIKLTTRSGGRPLLSPSLMQTSSETASSGISASETVAPSCKNRWLVIRR
ncbi:hypothetical protein E2C01_033700 [Portunus trituberculatus]|uniref:Uncharacterized protein n=1 Tax=Portunus trituberculatus TaxID=210409 RepID=A0A5B7F3D3_PORTR|nr:hypothetical protein [Portunus trituberculatus]